MEIEISKPFNSHHIKMLKTKLCVCCFLRQHEKLQLFFSWGIWRNHAVKSMSHFQLMENKESCFAMKWQWMHHSFMSGCLIFSRRYWQINAERHPLPREGFIHTTWAQRQSRLTPICTSPPPSASRQACLNHCPLPCGDLCKSSEGTGSLCRIRPRFGSNFTTSEFSVANQKRQWLAWTVSEAFGTLLHFLSKTRQSSG